MCGIAGVFGGRAGPDHARIVDGMLDRMQLRGPDDEGRWTDGCAYLGHRRLSILDLSSAGRQPMVSRDGRFVLSFNGEVYNHADLSRALGLRPEDLRSRADTEILVEGWARWKEGILSRIAGPFAFAVYDTAKQRLTLARDRFGEKPLFYNTDAGRLSFASTLRALLAVPWIGKRIDPDALYDLMTLRYVVGPSTILAGIQKLPPGHLLQVTSLASELVKWDQLPSVENARSPRLSEAVEEFDQHFRTAVARCRVSDVPVAMFLSDGIDSSSIKAIAEPNIPSYSYSTEESRVGPSIHFAGHTDLHVDGANRVQDLDEALASLTEPVGDGVALATWQLVRAAREHATVFLCGHGGDEIMGGYRLHQDLWILQQIRFLRWLPQRAVERFCGKYFDGDEPFPQRLRRVRNSSVRALPDAIRYFVHHPLTRADLDDLFGPARAERNRLATVDALYSHVDAQVGTLDRMQRVMTGSFLTENLLSFSDAVGMAWSAEIRMPFLDRDLVDFVWSLPPGFRARPLPGRSNNKRLLRRWARGQLDAEIIHRKKAGFASGSISGLLKEHGEVLRSRILDVSDLRDCMPGLERWTHQDPDRIRGARQGSYWALLALAIWYAALDAAPDPPDRSRAREWPAPDRREVAN